ncbi:DUF5819 family protein [Streptomyces sp. Li-HN-5-11]|uniref:DUF5819 family protein n=1 Tax=Streptomyces sp. Li-HN-5-11 TaxID=3075432 RepID=UPI0028AED77C|nr:DUF5819 family protein [Streptomyces sp. Li-HN-5-11]WNM28941.1 DUF5819 family protein [Streptomyces sp. Li-HN-5-11]
MDAYDEDSNAPHGRHGPGGSEGAEGPGQRVNRGDASPVRPAATGTGRPEPSSGEPHDRPTATVGPGPSVPAPSRPVSASSAEPPAAAPAPAASATVPGPGLAPAASGAGADSQSPAEAPAGVAALSPRYQAVAALALAAVAMTVCVHLAMVFLHVAPSNTLTKEHGQAVDDWIYPEFEQNWKLFAPNPLQQNIAVQVRADVRDAGGGTRTTGWYDLSAEDGRAIDGNLLPSHTQQNELRRAFDYYGATHDANDRATGLRGALAEQYLRRIVVLRLDRDHAAGPGSVVERVQIRSRTTNVPPPKWSLEKVSTTPAYRVLPWWTVPAGEAEGGVR